MNTDEKLPPLAGEPHEAAEAWALMWYGCECGHRERIWNARPGVTPFAMSCPSCGKPSLRHVNWQQDQRAEHHQPHRGQRVWVNLTIERAREYARHRVESAPPPYRPAPDEIEAVIEDVAQHEFAAFGRGTSPDGAVVGTPSIPATHFAQQAPVREEGKDG